jgi:DNA-binding MarR family transcriptional regulator
MTDPAGYESAAMPWLMLQARGSYGDASRRALAEAGCDDVPRNGGFILANLDGKPGSEFTPQADAVAPLRMSKQAASQLIDTLVLRGYVERRTDPEDRRRMGLRLTERGRAAAAAIQAGVDAIDAELERRISAEERHGLRAGLAALAEIREESDREGGWGRA